MDAVRGYDGLTKARQKLFDWVRRLSQEQYTQEFPFGLRTIRNTLIEMCLVEWLWSFRLRGETPPPREEWPIGEEHQPTFADLERVWSEQGRRTRGLLASITDWNTTLQWHPRVGPPGKKVTTRATRGDIALHMLFHEVHHRAQAMAMLRQFGIEAQNLDYAIVAFDRTEEPA